MLQLNNSFETVNIEDDIITIDLSEHSSVDSIVGILQNAPSRPYSLSCSTSCCWHLPKRSKMTLEKNSDHAFCQQCVHASTLRLCMEEYSGQAAYKFYDTSSTMITSMRCVTNAMQHQWMQKELRKLTLLSKISMLSIYDNTNRFCFIKQMPTFAQENHALSNGNVRIISKALQHIGGVSLYVYFSLSSDDFLTDLMRIATFAFNQKTVYASFSQETWIEYLKNAMYVIEIQYMKCTCAFVLVQTRMCFNKCWIHEIDVLMSDKTMLPKAHKQKKIRMGTELLKQVANMIYLWAPKGGYIFARCVQTGPAKHFWETSGLSSNVEAHFIFLQLAMNTETSCYRLTPRILYVPPAFMDAHIRLLVIKLFFRRCEGRFSRKIVHMVIRHVSVVFE